MIKSGEISTKILWLTLFSMAMAYLESVVVVYLRDIYYPEGFGFPLVPIHEKHLVAEIGREIATLVMLAAIGIIAGNTRWQKFAFFLFCFAVWDIFYYVFLKILINWPASFFTWDLLFLVPTVWTGPVAAPIITSLTMILFAIFLMNERSKKNKLVKFFVLLMIVGALLVIVAYTWDFALFMQRQGALGQIFNLAGTGDLLLKYEPDVFPWGLFVFAKTLLLLSLAILTRGKIMK